MTNTKAWYQSKTILVGLIGAIFGILSFFKVLPTDVDQDQVVQAVLVVTGLLTALFRKGATAEVVPAKQT